MKRAIILVLDSFGIGAAPDADKFGDKNANTLGHIAQWCMENRKDAQGKTQPLSLPNLSACGLGKAAEGATGIFPVGLDRDAKIIASHGYAKEISSGKDTPSGHWEIAGVPVLFDWDYFKDNKNSFPDSLLNKIIEQAKISGILGNCHASGTAILDELGEQHIKSGEPIFYTSADSVFQIAAHETHYGLEALYQLCETVRAILNQSDYNIGRVIARPFIGEKAGEFERTGNRRDYAVKPPATTVLEKLCVEKKGSVVSIGKIADIYAHVGITEKIKATGIEALFNATIEQVKTHRDNDSIIFTNFVNFDSDYGHRRNVAGYAAALEYFDSRLPELIALLDEKDLLLITADHGCDPTWSGSDHTREYIPVLCYQKGQAAENLGERSTFADIGQSLSQYFGVSSMDYGKSFFK